MIKPTSFRLLLLVAIFFSPVFAGLNVLTSYPPGDVFSFSNQPHNQYLAESQIAFSTLIDPPLPEDFTSNLEPATSLWLDGLITVESLKRKFNLYSTVDDVWNPNFAQNLFISVHSQTRRTVELVPEVYDWLKSQGVSRIFLPKSIKRPSRDVISSHTISETIFPGPFVLSAHEQSSSEVLLHNVYKLYLDEYEAFLFGAIPDLAGGGWILTNITSNLLSDDGVSNTQLIPVPSRVRMVDSKSPLAGTRFGLKDIFDAQGLPTAAGSIAYAQTHPIPNETAPSITKLLALGATMVGKTRTSQFAHGANPWEFVDVPYSWNPRGDGHLTASASSSGSACAIAGYNWLEFTVGSDTRGSVRKPAALTGVYGIRPSHGSLDLSGVVPLSEEMDTAGFFARHPLIFYEIATRWYGVPLTTYIIIVLTQGYRYVDSPVASNQAISRFPSKLLYPIDHYPVKSKSGQILVDGFISTLTRLLGINVMPVNFTEVLIPYFPNGSFPAFQQASNKLAEYRSWVDVGSPTTQEFLLRFGSLPVFDPIPQKMFARAKQITADDFAKAVALKRAFSDALAKDIFKYDEESCSDSIFMYDAATGGVPSYRVEDFNHLAGATPFLLTAAGGDNPASAASDFFNFLASMGELPEVTVPIGQVDYFSPLSRTWEPIPIAVQLVSRKGCDKMLLELVRQLAEAGVVRPVQVGRSIF
ncbi:Scytalone dehydratase-like protein Arp1 [Psilocybe cubensis]|uniref:Scytalone dehydratase-like protein Arp1 n=2 Tax=Psilocybe cubensis TaxID=181762 RepID=A0ACB8H325_PSICU|nr:Scytalone dehydratase-like protein Arp1 [Psilocybe cubensis]KAH9482271.1 Scytalone dehydratase-like protein Arp1 [Psilocybe cubensis]